MSNLRLVQAGQGARRPLVVVYHLGKALDGAIAAAAGPDACVVNDTEPPQQGKYGLSTGGIDRLPDAVAQAQALAGPFEAASVTLVAWSEGCAAIRAQLIAGYDPDATVCADGIQAALSFPAAQIDPWRAYAARARAGERQMLASHSQIEPPTTAAVRATLQRITGWPLTKSGPPEDPFVTRDGSLVVYSADGDDAPAHIAQAQVILPRMLRDAMTSLPADSGVTDGLALGTLLAGAAAGWLAVEAAKALLHLWRSP